MTIFLSVVILLFFKCIKYIDILFAARIHKSWRNGIVVSFCGAIFAGLLYKALLGYILRYSDSFISSMCGCIIASILVGLVISAPFRVLGPCGTIKSGLVMLLVSFQGILVASLSSISSSGFDEIQDAYPASFDLHSLQRELEMKDRELFSSILFPLTTLIVSYIVGKTSIYNVTKTEFHAPQFNGVSPINYKTTILVASLNKYTLFKRRCLLSFLYDGLGRIHVILQNGQEINAELVNVKVRWGEFDGVRYYYLTYNNVSLHFVAHSRILSKEKWQDIHIVLMRCNDVKRHWVSSLFDILFEFIG